MNFIDYDERILIPANKICNMFINKEDGKQLVLYRLPSSSRAYPLAFDKKVEAYRRMFEMMFSKLATP